MNKPDDALHIARELNKQTDPRVRAFLAAIIEVERKHGLSLSHEDGHGAFLVEPFSEGNARWLAQAQVAQDVPPLLPPLSPEQQALRDAYERKGTELIETYRNTPDPSPDA